MGYIKRYEDTYLDNEGEDVDSLGLTDPERIVSLLKKTSRTLKEEELITKLTERLLNGAKLPGPTGEEAVLGLIQVAQTYGALGAPDTAATLWAKMADVAELCGKRELYYRATEELTTLSEATYAAHHVSDNQ